MIKSVLCGMLVHAAVTKYKETKKLITLWLPIFIFVFCGFDHCIANMFYMAAASEFSIEAIGYNLICIAGNSIGAMALAKVIN